MNLFYSVIALDIFLLSLSSSLSLSSLWKCSLISHKTHMNYDIIFIYLYVINELIICSEVTHVINIVVSHYTHGSLLIQREDLRFYLRFATFTMMVSDNVRGEEALLHNSTLVPNFAIISKQNILIRFVNSIKKQCLRNN